MSNLRVGWTQATIEELTTPIEHVIPLPNEAFTYIDIGSVDRKTKRIALPQFFLGKDAPSRARKLLRKGDTLVSMTRPNLNAVALVSAEHDRQIASTGFDVLRSPGLDPRWIAYLVRTTDFVATMSDLVQGALYPAIKSKNVRSFVVPVAPRNEQTRIADKLDALLIRLDACRDHLERIPVILKRFRQSVLTAATIGKLTEEWRGGDVSNWTYELAVDVCAKVQSGSTPKEGFSKNGIPFLKVYNLVGQKVSFEYKPQYIDPDIHNGSMSRSQTQPGDVLMNIVGPPLGKVAIIPNNHPTWNINQAIALFRPSNRISTGWIYYVLCSGANIAEIIHETTGSAGQINISLTQCRNFTFPVPPIEEQAEIVRRVESLFAIADRLETRYTEASAQLGRLPSILLGKAFRGELLPQDPNDEPASVLLGRIRATKPSQIRQTRTPRKSPMAKHTLASLKEVIRKMPADRFSYDELLNKAMADYETLKDIVFALLAGSEPVLKQIFDEDAQAMRLEKVGA